MTHDEKFKDIYPLSNRPPPPPLPKAYPMQERKRLSKGDDEIAARQSLANKLIAAGLKAGCAVQKIEMDAFEAADSTGSYLIAVSCLFVPPGGRVSDAFVMPAPAVEGMRWRRRVTITA